MEDNQNNKFTIEHVKTVTDKYKNQSKKLERLYDIYDQACKSYYQFAADNKLYVPYSHLNYDMIRGRFLAYRKKLYLINAIDPYQKPFYIKTKKEFSTTLNLPTVKDDSEQKVFVSLINLLEFEMKEYLLKCQRSKDKNVLFIYALRDIYFKYGIARELLDLGKFVIINDALFIRREDTLYAVTPEIVQGFYNIPYKLSGTALCQIKRAFYNIVEPLQMKVTKGILYESDSKIIV